MLHKIKPLVTVIREAVRNFYADSCLDLSAAVAYYSLLSLAPLLVLTGSALGWAFKDSRAVEEALAHLSAFVPPEVSAALGQLKLGIRADGGLVLIALPPVLWAANRGFTALARALNVAFGTRRRRANWLARLKGFLIMTGGLVFLGASLVASTVLPKVNAYLESLGLPHQAALYDRLSTYVLSPLVSYSIFVLFYKLLPYGNVAWRPAAWGAGVTFVLWEGARRLFSKLLSYSHSFGLLSGAVAGIVAFLLWIYTAVAIIMLGAEVAAVLNGRERKQHRPRPREEGPPPPLGPARPVEAGDPARRPRTSSALRR